MSAKDISRFLFQPEKHYSSVRMQQGRVILDSDWNESERIDDEEARRTILDIICAKGTPNGGFRVTGVASETVQVPSGVGDTAADVEPGFTDVSTYDFRIGEGSFYLGGLRFELDGGGTSLLEQRDWLQIDADALNLPAPPSVADLQQGDRFDLVYLRGWEQCVTAVEDSELRERALGGPDSSARIRRMHRIEVMTNTAESCPAAFEQLKDSLTEPRSPDQSGVPHHFDGGACELRSKAKLTVAPAGEGTSEDPCAPAVESGFLGAENQTIRVELTATNRFIWGIDNAAPYYRVQVLEEDGQPVKIKFLTLPPDQRARPLKGQAVEIHPWGALLSNREKVAELHGHLTTVDTSFDPETRTLTISEPVPQAWLDWLDHPDHAEYLSQHDEDDRRKYFYLRLWTGGSGDAAEPDFAFTPGIPVELAGTGLTATFSANGLPGDHWIIAARPHTPSLFVAWDLMEEAPPAGTRLFFAPLAMIRWSVATVAGEQTVQPSVHDCRAKFQPLCDVRGCCMVTVGDGRTSHGNFQSIQDAVDSLPAGGGEVCVLPGVHETRVTVAGRRNIRVHGCGKQTLIIPSAEDRAAPLFRIVDSQCITLERMDVATLAGTAVVVTASVENGSKEIEIANNRILAYEQAIRVETASDVKIHHNRIRMLDKQGAGVGILLMAEDALIERNDIGVVPAERTPPEDGPGDRPDPADPCEDPERIFGNIRFLTFYLSFVFEPLIAILVALLQPFRALGGIQVAAGAERVQVLENKIDGGAGHGITLGGAVPVVETRPVEGDAPEVPLDHRDRQLWGDVTGPAGPVGNVVVLFRRTDGSSTTVTATTDAAGMFLVAAESGPYAVSIGSPGFQVEGIATENRGEFGLFHRIRVSEVAAEPAELLAFLYEIQIDGNEITRMGLCGIGIPRAIARQAGATLSQGKARADALRSLLGNPVVGLGVHRNHVHDCLQAPFDEPLQAEARHRGLGGISLALCEDVVISGNQIEENGTSHLNPTCGIFISFGERVSIHDNEIANNGPVRARRGSVLNGQRGGIVLNAASFGFDELLAVLERGVDTGGYAARIYDNVVWQPLGQALRLLALGPVSVTDNRLHSGDSGPETLERMAGAVLVLNAGGSRRLPAGLTAFETNQTRLGDGSDALTAQLIWTLDDLGYHDNQSYALTDGFRVTDAISLFVHVFLVSRTLRATDSRFKEPSGRGENPFKVSLLSRSTLVNNTTNNQGDHCIFASNTAPGRPAVTTGNQVIDRTLCPPLSGTIVNAAAAFAVASSI